MHCFENELMRAYLFSLARELDPTSVRDDLLLDQILDESDVRDVRSLLSLGTDDVIGLVRRLVAELPLAA